MSVSLLGCLEHFRNRQATQGRQNAVHNGGAQSMLSHLGKSWEDCCGYHSPVYPGATGILLGVWKLGPWKAITRRVPKHQAQWEGRAQAGAEALITRECWAFRVLGDRGLLSPGDLGIMMLDGEVFACPNCFIWWQKWRPTSCPGWTRD